jgi:hypothetical protein
MTTALAYDLCEEDVDIVCLDRLDRIKTEM